MAAAPSPPIWEQDEDVPLSGLGPSTVRRSKTTASRLQRFGAGASLNAPGSSRSSEVSRTSSLKLSPGISRIREYEEPPEVSPSSYEEQDGQFDVGDGVQEDEDVQDSVLWNPGSQSSLSRHSSMPLSRAVRRGNNASAPWNRTAIASRNALDIPASPIHATQHDHEGRMRSSSTAAEVRLFDEEYRSASGKPGG